MPDCEDFIVTYDGSREGEIRFAWNGKHAADLRDANYQFRKQVLDAMITHLDRIDLRLVRDVLRAETQLSKEAWAIDNRVGKLAETLLKRGQATYVEDYLLARMQSFDAYLGCATFEIDLNLARDLLRTVEGRLISETDEAKKRLWTFGKDTFEKWVQHLEAKTI